MKKYALLIVSLLLILVMCACGAEKPKEQTVPPTTTVPPTIPVFDEVENPVKFFSLSMGEDYENILRMDVFYNEDGTVHVEYVGKEKKVGAFDANIMHGITEAFLKSGLPALNGQDAYGEGEANASMYVEFSDSTMAAVGFSGEIPEAFAEGFGKLDQFFETLTASLPVYVPQPLVMGEVEEALLNPVLDILNNSGIENLDSFTISQVPKDEFFAYTAGLSSGVGVAGAVSCAPMMITDAYSLVLVELEEGTKAEDICADFEKNLNWLKWVCVTPSHAMIAQKDNMVLCLMGPAKLFTRTASGIQKAGWTEVKTLEKP